MGSRDRYSDSQQRFAAQFVTTHWSVVLAAGDRRDPASDRALEKLCRAYWPPLYSYARRRVHDIHAAQDLTQSFFARLLEKNYVAQVDAERGRFRAFLVTAFRHFLSNEWDKARSQKRGGGRAPIALDFAAQHADWSQLAEVLTAEQVYERQWAVTLLNRVMNRLQREMERTGNGRQWRSLKGFLAGSGRSSYATVAAELGLSEPAARMAASRLRKRYRELLRDEIAQTVSAQEDIDDEVRHLFTVFSK